MADEFDRTHEQAVVDLTEPVPSVGGASGDDIVVIPGGPPRSPGGRSRGFWIAVGVIVVVLFGGIAAAVASSGSKSKDKTKVSVAPAGAPIVTSAPDASVTTAPSPTTAPSASTTPQTTAKPATNNNGGGSNNVGGGGVVTPTTTIVEGPQHLQWTVTPVTDGTVKIPNDGLSLSVVAKNTSSSYVRISLPITCLTGPDRVCEQVSRLVAPNATLAGSISLAVSEFTCTPTAYKVGGYYAVNIRRESCP